MINYILLNFLKAMSRMKDNRQIKKKLCCLIKQLKLKNGLAKYVPI